MIVFRRVEFRNFLLIFNRPVKLALFVFCLFSLSPLGMAKAGELLLGYGSHYTKPYVIFDGEELTGGWLPALSSALAKELNSTVGLRSIPRKRYRQMLEDGELDTYCFTNPAWVKETKKITWSPELFSVRNVLITTNTRAKELKVANDLKGLNIGTILGYSYAPLKTLFKKKQAIRVDTRNFEANLRMLDADRIDAAIVPGYIADELMMELEMTDRFKEATYVVSTRSLHCAISESSKFDATDLTAAFASLVDHGHFEKKPSTKN